MQIDFDKVLQRTNEVLRYRDELVRQYSPFPDDQCAVVLETIGKHYMSGFAIDNDNRFTYDNIRRWADGKPFRCLDPMTGKDKDGDPKKGIYLCGPTGSGKTVLIDIMRYYGQVLNYKIRHDMKEYPLTWTPKRADTICDEFLTGGTLAPYIERKILCIDDAGTEPSETIYMGNRVQVVKSIIEGRADSPGKITIITSNYKIREDHYGDRVSSRLCEMCNYFELIHNDWRKSHV